MILRRPAGPTTPYIRRYPHALLSSSLARLHELNRALIIIGLSGSRQGPVRVPLAEFVYWQSGN